MRTALLYVFVTLLVQRRESRASDDFRPTPIPLKAWHYEKREGRAGTLHETIRTDAPPSIAAVPAHYWEDALRHSVYLTLVRDKIDQLIATSDVISSNSKQSYADSKEIDDRDLWDKIKSAPFDRIVSEEPSIFGDFTVMAKGRLMETNGGYRFTEDDKSKDNCADENCMEDVKAIWSVKRVRQRDVETSPGKYHYELTFSVITQTPNRYSKPHENPIRTFTVRESHPERIIGSPQEYRHYAPLRVHTFRPEKAVWFHKNIIPTRAPIYHSRKYSLDRIFSSLFSEDDPPYGTPTPRYKSHPYVTPPYFQHSKAGYVGPHNEQQFQKRPMQYLKPVSSKFLRPLPAPPVPSVRHQYMDVDTIGVVNPYTSQEEYRYFKPIKATKQPKPSFLPTVPITSIKTVTVESSTNINEIIEATTKSPEVVTVHYVKPKPTTMKVGYFPDPVRPPLYNAPPGVFVTMDKKPFIPMPPLKFYTTKSTKTSKPSDFRPSPQVLDIHFSEPDPLFNTAFRPITVNYIDSNTAEKPKISEDSNHGNKSHKPRRKKPSKKQQNMKTHRNTTAAPELITVHGDSSENAEMQWAEILGAFSKTTPMEPEKGKTESTASTISTTTEYTTSTNKTTITTTRTSTENSTTKPKKRTRPPPNFNKTDRIKNRKRVTTTTTTTSSEKVFKGPQHDLTPQASSTATATPTTTTPRITTPSTTMLTTTTVPSTTSTTTLSTSLRTISTSPTTTKATSTTTTNTTFNTTLQPKNKNRYRQSQLKRKGTSIKHEKLPARTTIIPPSGKFPPRRKGSNFREHIYSITPKNLHKQSDESNHKNHTHILSSSTTTEMTTSITSPDIKPTESYNTERDNQYDSFSESSSDNTHDQDNDYDDIEVSNKGRDGQEPKDHTHNIFNVSLSTETTDKMVKLPGLSSTEITIATSPHSNTNNQTKCKKNKYNNTQMNTVESIPENENDQKLSTIITTTTEKVTTADYLVELFGEFSIDDTSVTTTENEISKSELLEETENFKQYDKFDDDLEDFLAALNTKEKETSDMDDENEYDYNDGESYVEENENKERSHNLHWP